MDLSAVSPVTGFNLRLKIFILLASFHVKSNPLEKRAMEEEKVSERRN